VSLILQIQIEILLLVALGYILGKKGFFSSKTRAEVTNIVIYVILPCNVFLSFGKDPGRETLLRCGTVLLIGLAAQLLYIVLNRFLYRRFSPERQACLKYATICNNSGFMGLPVAGAVFGDLGLLYGSIVLIPIRIFMWTSGLSLFTKTDLKTKIKTIATHPCIWAVVLGFAYALTPVELPPFLLGTADVLAACTTALSMLVVGSILSEVDVKGVFEPACLFYSAIRLIAIPLAFYAVLRLLNLDPTVTGVTVLSSAMPAATTTAMLASKYGADAGFASKLIFVSTSLSLFTLPVLSLLLA
jgi:predicted permease